MLFKMIAIFCLLFVSTEPSIEAVYLPENLLKDIEKIQKNYDHSALDNYIIYKLYSLDKEQELFKGSLYKIYTSIYLSSEIAEREIKKEISLLEKEIKLSYETSFIDESLRRQVSSLAESIKILDSFFTGEATFKAIKENAAKVLNEGFERYKYLIAQMHTFAKKKPQIAQTPEKSLLEKMTEFASNQDRVIDYATAFEIHTKSPPGTKKKAACSATARALVYYFHEEGLLSSNLKESLEKQLHGIDTLILQLEKNRFETGHGFLYFADSAKLDHMFVIQQTSDGSYRILQSFINKYTLFANLSHQNKDLSYSEVIEFCRDIKTILNSSHWNESTAQKYKDVFLSLPGAEIQEEFPEHDSDFSFIELTYTQNNWSFI